MLLGIVFENWEYEFENFFWVVSEACLNKTANEYLTEVAIPHVLSSKE
jgi:hypothetical protein